MRLNKAKRKLFHKNQILRAALLAAALSAVLLGTTACGGGSADPSPSPTPEAVATPEPVVKVKVATVNDGVVDLNVRSAGSTDSEILGTAQGKDRFVLKAEDNPKGWHEVDYNGKTAYLFAEYVTVEEIDETALATPTPAATDVPEVTDAPEATDAPKATATPAATAAPTATPDPDVPIRVDGSGRDKETSSAGDGGMTADTIRDKEDPARR